MESSKTQLTERFVELMVRIYLAVRPHLPAEWLELELTLPQVRTLVLLSQNPSRMVDIATRLGISVSSATGMIDRLEAKQLVERIHEEADRRVVRCHLTPLGREVVARFWQIGRSRIEALADVLSSQELDSVVGAMEVLSTALEREAGPSGPAWHEAAGGGSKQVRNL